MAEGIIKPISQEGLIENPKSSEDKEPDNREDTGRNPDGTWKPGVSGNPGGRSKKPLKEYGLKIFNDMTDEQKDEFLKSIPNGERWRMIEGNPRQDTDITSGGKPIPILNLNEIHKDNRNKEDTETNEED